MRALFMAFALALLVFLCLVAAGVLAADLAVPIAKAPGQQCATNYAQSGGYCVPARRNACTVVRKIGQCPSSSSQSGGYCLICDREERG
jgi:hypothetical protein